MNKSRSLFLVCILLFVGLFAFNSYADDVTISWRNGTYTGEVSNGVPHGQGIWTHPDGKKYVGQFKDGKMTGQGTSTWSDGIKYVAGFKDGNCWQGTEYDKDGNITAILSNGVRKEK